MTIVESITKYAVTITDPKSVRFHMEKALCLAKSGRPGPVWIDVPMDVQAAQVDVESLPGFVPEQENAAGQGKLKEQVRELLAMLGKAERPVIVAGNGIRVADAIPEFLRAVEKEDTKTGGIAADRLRSLVDRIERLEEERKALGGDIRDIYAEAKSAGFDVKVLRQLIRIRKQEPADVEEQETLLDVYRRALGM